MEDAAKQKSNLKTEESESSDIEEHALENVRGVKSEKKRKGAGFSRKKNVSKKKKGAGAKPAMEVAKPHACKAKGKAFWGHEDSRSQIMGRTGNTGPGSTKMFTYGMGQPYLSFNLEEKAAKAWVQKLDK